MPSNTYFYDLVSEIDGALKRNEVKAKYIFRKYLEECHPFIFMPIHKAGEVEELTRTEEPLDLPFPNIHIEVQGMYITVPEPGLSPDESFWICSFAVGEIGPKEYDFMVLVETQDGRKVLVESSKAGGGSYIWPTANAYLKTYLDRLSKEKAGYETPGPSRKIGGGKNKKLFKLRPIVHVAPKNRVGEVRATLGHKTVDWSFRFEIRGHWRAVKGIGKDRAGEYKVNGFTWVTNHERGPKDAPLIKKTYVVE